MRRLFLIACLLFIARPAIPQTNNKEFFDKFFSRMQNMKPIACSTDALDYIHKNVERDRDKQPDPPDSSHLDPIHLMGCPFIVREAEREAFFDLAYRANKTPAKAVEEFSDMQSLNTFAEQALQDYLLHNENAKSADHSATVSVFYWANDLNEMCQNDPAPVGTTLPAFTKDALTSPAFLNILKGKVGQGMCGGYILGHSEALSQIAGKVCFPLNNPGDDLIAAVKDKLAKRPVLNDKQLPASIAVDLALQELFPCPKQ